MVRHAHHRRLGGNPSEVALIAVFAVMSLLMSELTSHTAATNMVGPLGITAAMRPASILFPSP